MTSNDESWMIDAVDDLIHSSIWLTPVQTFIDEHCVYFEIDESEESSTLPEEQTQIHENYFDLIRSLIDGLALDLGVDKTRLRDCSLKKETIIIDEFYEQLHSAKNVELFREMMRKRNLILQLQALAHIQIKTDDDEILRLVVRATRSTNQNENRFDDRAKTKSLESATTIDSIPESVLRQKLDEFNFDEDPRAAISSRHDFLKEQRDLLIEKQKKERTNRFEEETKTRRPSSAVQAACRAMSTTSTSSSSISKDEMDKRKLFASKFRREILKKP